MVDFTKRYAGRQQTVSMASSMSAVFNQVYGWMSAGLALSAFVSWYVLTRSNILETLSMTGFVVLLVAELALVLTLSAAINKLPAIVATMIFLVYAALNGVTLSVILITYAEGVVLSAFLTTAAMFGTMALFGTVTGKDLSSLGRLCGMALWGLIVAGIVQIILLSFGLCSADTFMSIDLVVSVVGVLVFTGLTAWDAQKIKMLAERADTLDDAAVRKLGILGALTLYLDFINMFLYLLRLFGRKR